MNKILLQIQSHQVAECHQDHKLQLYQNHVEYLNFIPKVAFVKGHWCNCHVFMKNTKKILISKI